MAAGGGRPGGQRTPGLVSHGDRDQACLQGRPRARRGPHHEPPVILAAAEHPQLDRFARQPGFVNIPPAVYLAAARNSRLTILIKP
jgi:hypothetical protein